MVIRYSKKLIFKYRWEKLLIIKFREKSQGPTMLMYIRNRFMAGGRACGRQAERLGCCSVGILITGITLNTATRTRMHDLGRRRWECGMLSDALRAAGIPGMASSETTNANGRQRLTFH